MAQQKIDLQILQETYHLLPDYIQIEQKTTYTTNSEGYETSRQFIVNQRVKMTNQSNYLQFKETVLNKLKDKENIGQVERAFQNLFTQLVPIYSEGDVFGQVDGVEQLISSDEGYKAEPASYKHTLGQVTLVDIWATWCGPCQNPMAHNQKMLEENEEKWKNKAVIVGISVDDDTEDVKQRIVDRKWDKIQHYRFVNGWDDNNDTIKSLQLRGIPFVILLDKQGRIRYRGHPTKTNLEEQINKYIEAGDEYIENKEEKQEEKQEIVKEKGEVKQLQQDQFKQLKTLLKTDITNTAKDMNKEKMQFFVELIKRNKINRDGTKVNIERSPIQLTYVVEAEQKQLIDSFTNDVWNKIPEEQRIFKKCRVNDIELDKKLIKEKFAEAAKQVGFSLNFETKKMKEFIFANELGNFSLQEQQICSAQCKLTAEDFKKWQELLREFVQTYEEYEEQMEFIEKLTDYIKNGFVLKVNDQFETIDNYHKIDQEIEQITHKPGQVLVIDYWAKWCGPCVNGIKKNTLLLKNNAGKWGDKLRFVCLSLVLQQDCKEFMDSIKESQELIEFYFPKQERQSDATKYGVRYIPHYVVIDKQGKIRAIASVQNLEGLINQLMEEEVQEDQQLNQEKIYYVQEQMDQLHTLLKSNIVKESLGGFNNQYTFTLKLRFEEEWGRKEGSDEEVLLKYSQPHLSYFVRKPQFEKLGLFLDQVYSIISKDNFKIEETVSNIIDIPFPGKECVLCKKELNDQMQQYYSPFKNEFVCCECAEFDDNTKKGLARYKYTDTLIFINAPLTDLSVVKDIDDHKIGKNLKIKDDEAGSQRHEMCCNGCQKMKEGPRYISVSARPGKLRGGGYVDYCQGCFENLKNKDSEEAKAIAEKDKKDGMVSDSCLVRILFNLGYYDF